MYWSDILYLIWVSVLTVEGVGVQVTLSLHNRLTPVPLLPHRAPVAGHLARHLVAPHHLVLFTLLGWEVLGVESLVKQQALKNIFNVGVNDIINLNVQNKFIRIIERRNHLSWV